jgi:hypothetical protein
MNEQWVVISRGGGTEKREGQFRVTGHFTSFESAEFWMEQEFGEAEKMPTAVKNHPNPQVVRIESPEEF